ncbi:hypothetical protein NM208_g6591 [Fusarium decemcellulare]|uniref:Uncharacterized protein n=1 Tax=Fusarium decemcellulare TaxID=57161 RepID=A0ACC1SCK7_9HYPO|nr:hypothetical protein NM208_g6591 [Fusarium decemcellulare]
MNSQIYPNLPDPATSIRLLRIEPGWPADPLSVQLTVVPDRNAAPSYDALSYVYIDGQSMKDCPSWAPLWTEPRKTLGLQQELFNSNLGKNMHLDHHDESTLRVSGYSFERVQVLSPGLKASSQTTANMSSNNASHYPPHNEEIKFVTSAWDLAESFQVTVPEEARTLQRPYQSADTVLEAFVYTLCGNRNEATDNGRADASNEVLDSAKAWLEKFVDQFSQSTSFLSKIWHGFLEAMYPGNGLSFQACVFRACISRRFFMTSSGFMGIGPESMKEGDLVVVIFGLSLPFVLLQSQTDADKFLVVGPCYVHGIMEGELVTALEGQSPRVFTLV